MIVNGMMGMIEQDMYGHKRDQGMDVRKGNRKYKEDLRPQLTHVHE